MQHAGADVIIPSKSDTTYRTKKKSCRRRQHRGRDLHRALARGPLEERGVRREASWRCMGQDQHPVALRLVLQGAMQLHDKTRNEEVDAKSATVSRRSAAMLNYSALGRPDLSFASTDFSDSAARGQTEAHHQVPQSGEKSTDGRARQTR